jgi:hypothetical protein
MYSKLSKYFADVKDKSAHDVCVFIGGKVEQNDFKNCCAVRMSYAFNKSGIKIPFTENKTVSGEGKKDWYIYRVKDFKDFLNSKNYTKHTTKQNSLKDFDNKKGVIVFDVDWADATGHVDLFNGKSVEGSDYTSQSKSITLYEIN